VKCHWEGRSTTKTSRPRQFVNLHTSHPVDKRDPPIAPLLAHVRKAPGIVGVERATPAATFVGRATAAATTGVPPAPAASCSAAAATSEATVGVMLGAVPARPLAAAGTAMEKRPTDLVRAFRTPHLAVSSQPAARPSGPITSVALPAAAAPPAAICVVSYAIAACLLQRCRATIAGRAGAAATSGDGERDRWRGCPQHKCAPAAAAAVNPCLTGCSHENPQSLARLHRSLAHHARPKSAALAGNGLATMRSATALGATRIDHDAAHSWRHDPLDNIARNLQLGFPHIRHFLQHLDLELTHRPAHISQPQNLRLWRASSFCEVNRVVICAEGVSAEVLVGAVAVADHKDMCSGRHSVVSNTTLSNNTR